MTEFCPPAARHGNKAPLLGEPRQQKPEPAQRQA